MADSNADKIAQVKAFQEVQNANAIKQNDLRKQAAQLEPGPERDALMAKRQELIQANKDIDARIQQVAPNNSQGAVYEGVDKNSGQNTYVNPVTGERFISPDAPSTEQKNNSIPFGADQADKARETALAADNKANQQGYAGNPEPTATKPANDSPNVPVKSTADTTSDPAISTAQQQATPTNAPLAEPTKVSPTSNPTIPEVQAGDPTYEVPPSVFKNDPSATVPSYFGETTGTGAPKDATPYSAQFDSFPTPIVEQKKLTPAEDATAKKAIDAQSPTTETTSPNEQTVINASSDAQLSKEQQAKLEKEQADNRAVLAKETAGQKEPNVASSVDRARATGVAQFQRNTVQQEDWRLRLSLSKSSDYLYRAATVNDILYPLKGTDGVIFPYTPQIQMGYRANYEPTDLTHSNYKMYYYRNSAVDDITITADFTAQDTSEANYLLAVMHFFKSVTKMFYGRDTNPSAGTPPPLCYLNGYGQYQFNEHPCLVASCSYVLPNDVDYLRAGRTTQVAGQNYSSYVPPAQPKGTSLISMLRTQSNRLTKGGLSAGPSFQNYSNKDVTYVPTKIQFQIVLHPVVTRYDISNDFSLKDYATGKLTTGNRRNGGGIW